MRELNQDLVLWAKRKYKKLRRHHSTGGTLDRAHFATRSGVGCSLKHRQGRELLRSGEEAG
jgi:hypothetical protein